MLKQEEVDDGWQTVPTKKAKKRGRTKTNQRLKQGNEAPGGFSFNYTSKKNGVDANEAPVTEKVEHILQEIERLEPKIRATEFYALLEKTLMAFIEIVPQEMVCYGLGSLEHAPTGSNCLHQLVLADLIRKLLSIPSILIFDPILKEVDIVLVEKLGFQLLQVNEAGKRLASKRTLFFMPHCPMRLYSNLLWTNWGSFLANTIIIGNSFAAYDRRTLVAATGEGGDGGGGDTNAVLAARRWRGAREAPLPFRPRARFKEDGDQDGVLLPNGYAAFHDLSLMWFSEQAPIYTTDQGALVEEGGGTGPYLVVEDAETEASRTDALPERPPEYIPAESGAIGGEAELL